MSKIQLQLYFVTDQLCTGIQIITTCTVYIVAYQLYNAETVVNISFILQLAYIK